MYEMQGPHLARFRRLAADCSSATALPSLTTLGQSPLVHRLPDVLAAPQGYPQGDRPHVAMDEFLLPAEMCAQEVSAFLFKILFVSTAAGIVIPRVGALSTGHPQPCAQFDQRRARSRAAGPGQRQAVGPPRASTGAHRPGE